MFTYENIDDIKNKNDNDVSKFIIFIPMMKLGIFQKKVKEMIDLFVTNTNTRMLNHIELFWK